MYRQTLRALGGFASCAVIAPAAAAQYQYTRPLAIMGQPANGLPSGLNYYTVFVPNRDLIINKFDQVLTQVYALDLSNTSRAELVLYSGSSAASFQPVSRWGAEFPGLPGVTPGLYGQMNLNAHGMAVFSTDLKGAVTPADDLGLFMGRSPSDLLLLGRQGSPAAPDLPSSITHLSFFFPVVNSSGLLSVGLNLGGATNQANNSGIYVRQLGSGPFRRLAYESAPTPDDFSQAFGQALVSRLNDNNEFFLLTGLTGNGITTANDTALWSGTNTGSLRRVAQEGNAAPGLPAGVNYGTFSTAALTLNHAGRRAFGATLTSATAGQVTTANDNAVFIADPDTPATVFAREGDLAPIPGNTTARYAGAFGLALAGNGTVVLGAGLTNRSFNADSGLFAGTTPANVAPIALEGQRPPETPAGSTFYYDTSGQSAFSSMSVNASGQVVFMGSMRYSVNGPYQEGLFAYDPVQGLILLHRTGGTIDVNGVLKTITSIDLGNTGNGEDGQGSPFNDRGTVVFQASGADFTGVFTTRIPIVGDVNRDGRVSFTDFQILERGFGSTDADRPQGDLNGDRVVDDADFRLLYRNLWTTAEDPLTPAQQQEIADFAATVPEPGALAALALAATSLLARRCRRARRHTPSS